MLRLRTMLSISAGFAAGYVAGAKAGRPAYDRIMTRMSEYAESLGLTSAVDEPLDAAQRATDATADRIHEGTTSAAEIANEEIAQLRERVNSSGRSGRPDQGRQQGATVTA